MKPATRIGEAPEPLLGLLAASPLERRNVIDCLLYTSDAADD